MKLFTENKDRLLTGAVLLVVVVGIGLIDNLFLTWLFLGIVYMFAFYEAVKLFGLDDNKLFAFGAMLWCIALFDPDPDLFFMVALIYGAVQAYRPHLDPKMLLPFLYPTTSFLFILALYTDYGMASLFWLLTVVAITDIGAWLVGNLIGKTPFSPTSPKKTWEGVAGGVVLATLAGSFAGAVLVDPPIAVAVSLGTSVASVFGDLYESYLKRKAGVKDSGDILPGHGGILDRVDGYLFGAVAMVLLLRGLL